MENINSSYFEGHYKDIWKAIIPEELTRREVDFLVSYFELDEKKKVLDVMCGFGRHAIGLARKGIPATAVDNLEDYYKEIKAVAENENLPLTAIRADISSFEIKEKFDLALCMGNSLNFFNEDDSIEILKNLRKMLNDNGNLLINSWSLAETVIREFKEHYWSHVGNLKQLNEGKFKFNPTRIEWETWIISPDNKSEHRKGVDYIFSVAEMKKILHAAGFKLKIIYSVPGKREFALGDQRAYIIASVA
jgi:cyclopropane fatty-acyl-phospholipid synthase-like methyltransferase